MTRRRVLVVDDEDALRVAVCELLRHDGFEAIGARDGEAAVARISATKRFDAVLLDLLMPRINGVEVFRVINEMLPGVPVILMSGLLEAEALCRFEPQALAGFLQKPFLRATLVQTVHETIRDTQQPSERTRTSRAEQDNAAI